MPTNTTTRAITHLLRERAAIDDDELLGDFVERRDEAALGTIICRHGPMAWGVCRRLLSHHDAEDAFQAAFLVLVRKAASVTPRDAGKLALRRGAPDGAARRADDRAAQGEGDHGEHDARSPIDTTGSGSRCSAPFR